MSMNEESYRVLKFGIVGILVITAVFAGSTIYRFYANGEPTGVCIYKGPPFYGTGLFGGTTSSGTPLRGITVTAWRNASNVPGIGNVPGKGVFAEGQTDRTGCFIFTVFHGWEGYISYTYNGTQYTDLLKAGLVLQDNLP